jgi:hypothetical protein
MQLSVRPHGQISNQDTNWPHFVEAGCTSYFMPSAGAFGNFSGQISFRRPQSSLRLRAIFLSQHRNVPVISPKLSTTAVFQFASFLLLLSGLIIGRL